MEYPFTWDSRLFEYDGWLDWGWSFWPLNDGHEGPVNLLYQRPLTKRGEVMICKKVRHTDVYRYLYFSYWADILEDEKHFFL